jgi:hypothetical protein
MIKEREYISKSIFIDWKITKSNFKSDKIISCVFFLKEKLSKDINKYLKNLKKLIDLIININDYKLRIYHDFSSLNYIKEMININDEYKKKLEDKLELYEYDAPFFRDENTLYHKGTIGTLFRYLCIFDFKLHYSKISLIVDIDNDPKLITNSFLKFLETNSNFAYRFRFMYGIKDRIICNLDDNLYQFSIIGSFVFNNNINNNYINKDLFSNFLEDVYINKKDIIIKMLNNCNIENFYGYGIDEIFLNKILLSYLYKNKINIQPLNINNFQPIIENIFQILITLNQQGFYDEIITFIDYFNKILNKINTKINLQLNIQNLKEILKKYKENNKLNTYISINLIKNKNIILPVLDEIMTKYKNNIFYKILKCLKNYILYHNYGNYNQHTILNITTDYDFQNNKVINKEIRLIKYNG